MSAKHLGVLACVLLLLARATAFAQQEPATERLECPACTDVGTPVTEADIAAWNIDIKPSGEGLPPGAGTAFEGRRIFEFGPTGLLPASPAGISTDPSLFTTCPGGPSKCAICHGIRGIGGLSAPQLVGGRDPDNAPRHPLSPDSARTVGSYWPYATTLFDYVRRAMPFDCPGSLTDDEVYAVTAYLLYLNGVINADEVMNESTLPPVNERLPNHPNFYQTPPPYLPKGQGPVEPEPPPEP